VNGFCRQTPNRTQQHNKDRNGTAGKAGSFFEQVRADADFATFANELRRHQVSYYIYFVSTGNMNFVMANDEVISIKSARGLLRVRSAPSHRLTSAAVIRHFAGAINFEQYCGSRQRRGV
jgi:uncharacterized protein YbcV (DUF1398 family)